MNLECLSRLKIVSASFFSEGRGTFCRVSSTGRAMRSEPVRNFAGSAVGLDDAALIALCSTRRRPSKSCGTPFVPTHTARHGKRCGHPLGAQRSGARRAYGVDRVAAPRGMFCWTSPRRQRGPAGR